MSVTSTNPNTIFGGTWEQLKDRFLLGTGDTYQNGITGGSANVTLTTENLPVHAHGFSGTNELQKHYEYNGYNELIVEENYENNKKTEYSYDNSGNLVSSVTINMLTGGVLNNDNYAYENDKWADQLTKFNNSQITYDQIGNPITIGNDINLTWINGKELKSINNQQKNLEILYEYDYNGIRTSKIINGELTKYVVEDSRVLFEDRNGQKLSYLYDLNDIQGLIYNNSTYYYKKNAQNDIIGILDADFNQIVYYEYDSWGNIICIKDENGNIINDSNNVGNINPFRYRSYYYDTETGLYYLNSRYYNPKWRRFLNIDNRYNVLWK